MRSRAIAALLLLFLFTLPACADQSATGGAERERTSEEVNAVSQTIEETTRRQESTEETTRLEKTIPESASAESKAGENSEKQKSERTVEAVLPEDVLSEDEIAKPNKYRDWNEPGSDEAPKQLVSGGSSVGAIPAVKPFNFGRDPGGPEDKTLYLTIPKLGLNDVPVYNSTSEEDLTASTVHVPATGFPWQEGANTFIAGHRIGYAGTGSLRIFYSLDQMVPGDEILLTDSAGGEYRYRVTRQIVVGPDNVEVMSAVEGKSLVSLQTCTLPDYAERLVVQGELIETSG